MTNTVKLYHGSRAIIPEPDIEKSRLDIDFGKGFYLSEDFNLPAKWACKNATSVVNQYALNLDGLNVYKFNLDETWLHFVVANRNLTPLSSELEKINKADVLIGAVADDKLFYALDLYDDGILSDDYAIKVMSCMSYGNQYVLKTKNAINNLVFEKYVRITGQEKQAFLSQYKEDGREASRRTKEILREINRGGVIK